MRNYMFLAGILIMAFLTTLAGAIGSHVFERPVIAAAAPKPASLPSLEVATLKAEYVKYDFAR